MMMLLLRGRRRPMMLLLLRGRRRLMMLLLRRRRGLVGPVLGGRRAGGVLLGLRGLVVRLAVAGGAAAHGV
uniref:Uncharacterized protein n=1 Tax=Arundo donax TaxID=35708 RepID=A0A0A9E9Y7_ARUDO